MFLNFSSYFFLFILGENITILLEISLYKHWLDHFVTFYFMLLLWDFSHLLLLARMVYSIESKNLKLVLIYNFEFIKV